MRTTEKGWTWKNIEEGKTVEGIRAVGGKSKNSWRLEGSGKQNTVNACVANGGAQGSGDWPQQPKPRSVEHPISLPYLQPSHEPRPPPQTPNQAPATLNSEFNGETIEERPLLPRIGRGGRGKTRKHMNATTPNAEPSQSHEAMCRRTSKMQRSRWPLELPENTLGKHPTDKQNTHATNASGTPLQ